MKRAGRLLVLALAALAVVSACAAADSTPVGGPPLLPPPTVVVHLSDIHYSTNVRKYWDLFGNREGDALLWAEQLVPRLGLAGAAITGDITDSKARARLRGCLVLVVQQLLALPSLLFSWWPPDAQPARPSAPTPACRPLAARGCSRRPSGWRTPACCAPWPPRGCPRGACGTCQATTTPSICPPAAAPKTTSADTLLRGAAAPPPSSASTCTACRRRSRQSSSSSSRRAVPAATAAAATGRRGARRPGCWGLTPHRSPACGRQPTLQARGTPLPAPLPHAALRGVVELCVPVGAEPAHAGPCTEGGSMAAAAATPAHPSHHTPPRAMQAWRGRR